MNTFESLKRRRKEILEVALKHGATNVRVFGSVVRGDDTAQSDLDLLVDMENGRSLYDLIGFQQEMEDLLGHRVDVLTERGINHQLKDYILAEARAL